MDSNLVTNGRAGGEVNNRKEKKYMIKFMERSRKSSLVEMKCKEMGRGDEERKGRRGIRRKEGRFCEERKEVEDDAHGTR